MRTATRSTSRRSWRPPSGACGSPGPARPPPPSAALGAPSSATLRRRGPRSRWGALARCPPCASCCGARGRGCGCSTFAGREGTVWGRCRSSALPCGPARIWKTLTLRAGTSSRLPGRPTCSPRSPGRSRASTFGAAQPCMPSCRPCSAPSSNAWKRDGSRRATRSAFSRSGPAYFPSTSSVPSLGVAQTSLSCAFLAMPCIAASPNRLWCRGCSQTTQTSVVLAPCGVSYGWT
mmetsp:Transcript_26081/g.81325  ORF Transcript_26081/g.81325 Transcript_26081/m.81325 type:complete len:234 (+) Transcript_26081:403-1104(+)